MSEDLAPVAVVVCTLNEEANLARCLRSVQWAQQRFVVDADSTDRTPDIGRLFGATVVTHQWTGYSDQKNWALDNLGFGTKWVLFLDADESVPEELSAEIQAVLQKHNSVTTGYYIARRMIFMGRWLKHAWWYPDYNLRLFLRSQGRFENRLVHESVSLKGTAGYLSKDLVHDDQRDIATYVSRLNRYSSLEAIEMSRRSAATEMVGNRMRGSLRGNWAQRRRFVKEQIWYRLPMRPGIRFVWTMIFRLGFLDGREGLIFTLLQCVSEWHTSAKLYELQAVKRAERFEPSRMPALTFFRTDTRESDDHPQTD